MCLPFKKKTKALKPAKTLRFKFHQLKNKYEIILNFTCYYFKTHIVMFHLTPAIFISSSSNMTRVFH